MSWTSSPLYNNKWDRIMLTKKGPFVVSWVSVNDDIYTSCVVNVQAERGNIKFAETDTVIQKDFKSLESAKQFADKTLKSNGFDA